MNEDFDEPQQSMFTTLQHSGWLYLLVVLILVGLASRHLWLSVRSIVRPGASVSASLHAIHLLSIPAIVIFYLLARLSTSFPELFVRGIDADMPLKYGLQEAEFLGVFGLVAFLLTLFSALVSIQRNGK